MAADAEPWPYQLERYEALWATPLFVSEQIAETLPVESSAPEAAYRFLGMGTANGVELAYIQAPGRDGSRTDRGDLQELPNRGTTLVNVERTPDGGVAAVIFRKEDSIHRAALASSPPGPRAAPPGPPPAPGPGPRSCPPARRMCKTISGNLEAVRAACSAQPTVRTRLRQASACPE